MQQSARVSLAAVVLCLAWAADLAQSQTFDTMVPDRANRARVVDVAIKGDGFATFDGGTGTYIPFVTHIKLIHQETGVELGPVPATPVATTMVARGRVWAARKPLNTTSQRPGTKANSTARR